MFGQGWIGCDFDGTLAVAPSPYDPTTVGAPIPKMVERVKAWLAEGKDVRIFTARVAYVSPEMLVKIEAAIQKFCLDNLGKALPVTCIKDHEMLEFWDDRARQVELNTGVSVRSIPDSSLTSGTDRALEFVRVIKQYTEAFGDPDNWPVDSRDNMFEMLRSTLRDVVQKPFWSRLGIGYSNVSGQSFPEACALDTPHSLGPQGEPIYAEQGGVKRCVACICGGCEEHEFRYSDDQPRDEHGRFGSGGSSAVAIDKQAAMRPTAEQHELRAGYKEAFDAAKAKFSETASKYGVISGRVKTIDSIANKMATNPNYIGKPLSELQDIAGLRCTTPDVQSVRDAVAALTSDGGLKIVSGVDNKMDTPQGFYRAIHLQFDSMGENKFGERVGEIQVRTERQGQIAMWGHDCAYKGPFKKDEEVQAYARAVSNAAWELDNGRPASYPDKVPAQLAERDLGFKPDKTYTDDWLFKERGDKYWEQT